MESNKEEVATDVLIQYYIVGSVEYPNWVQGAKGVNKRAKEGTTQ